MDTPSLVIVGAPHFFSRTTLRPLGPNVTLTASASWFMPRSRPRRASSSNAMIFGIGECPSVERGGRGAECDVVADARDGRTWLVPRTDRGANRALAGRLWHSDALSARSCLALGSSECKETVERYAGPGEAARGPVVAPLAWPRVDAVGRKGMADGPRGPSRCA